MGKFRPGDIVSVTATVKYGEGEDGKVILENRTVVHSSEITLVCPFLDANEEVTITDEECNRTSTATVRATHGELAWLELEGGQMITRNAIDVNRKT